MDRHARARWVLAGGGGGGDGGVPRWAGKEIHLFIYPCLCFSPRQAWVLFAQFLVAERPTPLHGRTVFSNDLDMRQIVFMYELKFALTK